ncbi:MAG: class I SAM-dependent methyltransferase [Deltaproteobacteria bacterium]|nr:class I SAM-dependent methyltransferase [Deltaproteobacteria bacterium]MBW2416334.1 class I SAM-dependent methyltransferase [Deltaproteobacteria bacterium]
MRKSPPGKRFRLLRRRESRPDAVAAPALRVPRGAPLQALREVLDRLSDASRGAKDSDPGVRLLSKGETLDEEAAREALSPVPLAVWEASGLLRCEHGKVVPRVRLARYSGLTVACDVDWHAGGAPRDDAVMGITTSTLCLASFTPRGRAARALDLGTGSGLQALLAARHCDRVTAVDLNPRALEFARFNAALNGVENVDFVRGDLLEFEADEPYDLVVCNPPFVISPRSDCLYRDNPLDADGFVQALLQRMPGLLAEGGFGQVVCDWGEGADEPWADHVSAWVRDRGCDAWVLRAQGKDPAAYARTYLGALPEPEQRERLQEWKDYYTRCGIEQIGFGVVTLRKAGGRPSWFRAEGMPPRISRPAGGEIARGFDATDFLRAHPGAVLLEQRLRTAPHVRVEPRVEAVGGRWCTQSARLTRTRGFPYALDVDPAVLDVVLRSDGTRTLGELLQAAANARKTTAAELAPTFVKVIHQLVARGFLLPATRPDTQGAEVVPASRTEEIPDEPKTATG